MVLRNDINTHRHGQGGCILVPSQTMVSNQQLYPWSFYKSIYDLYRLVTIHGCIPHKVQGYLAVFWKDQGKREQAWGDSLSLFKIWPWIWRINYGEFFMREFFLRFWTVPELWPSAWPVEDPSKFQFGRVSGLGRPSPLIFRVLDLHRSPSPVPSIQTYMAW